jgi:hypothetical protein
LIETPFGWLKSMVFNEIGNLIYEIGLFSMQKIQGPVNSFFQLLQDGIRFLRHTAKLRK